MFGRIIIIAFALIVASMLAGITLAIGIVAPEWPWLDSDPVERVSFFVVSFFATSFIGAIAFVPALLLIVMAETLRLRWLLYYAVAGAVVGSPRISAPTSNCGWKPTDVCSRWPSAADRGGGRDHRRTRLLAAGRAATLAAGATGAARRLKPSPSRARLRAGRCPRTIRRRR